MADLAARGNSLVRGGYLGSVAVFLAATLMLAGAIHIAAILLVPLLAASDGWSRLARYAGDGAFEEVPALTPGSDGVRGLDPLFVTGACRLQLQDGPAYLQVDPLARFWSLALYDPSGNFVFSLNDRTAVDGRLDMRISLASADVPAETGDTIEQMIGVTSDSADLIALLRVFAPTAFEQVEARRLLAVAACATASPEAGGNE